MNDTQQEGCAGCFACLLVLPIIAFFSSITTLILMGFWNYGIKALYPEAAYLGFLPALWISLGLGAIGQFFRSQNTTSKDKC